MSAAGATRWTALAAIPFFALAMMAAAPAMADGPSGYGYNTPTYDQAVIEGLIRQLGFARDEDDREQAARRLGQLRIAEAIPALQHAAVYDEDDDVREEARDAIFDIEPRTPIFPREWLNQPNDKIGRLIVDLLSNRDEDDREDAAEDLEDEHGIRALPMLEYSGVYDREEDVRDEASESARDLRDDLRELVRKGKLFHHPINGCAGDCTEPGHYFNQPYCTQCAGVCRGPNTHPGAHFNASVTIGTPRASVTFSTGNMTYLGPVPNYNYNFRTQPSYIYSPPPPVIRRTVVIAPRPIVVARRPILTAPRRAFTTPRIIRTRAAPPHPIAAVTGPSTVAATRTVAVRPGAVTVNVGTPTRPGNARARGQATVRTGRGGASVSAAPAAGRRSAGRDQATNRSNDHDRRSDGGRRK